jgi:hypothetical protein
MQHVAPLEQHILKHSQLIWLQHGQLHQGSHVLLASIRCTLSEPSISGGIQGVLRKPLKVSHLPIVLQH